MHRQGLQVGAEPGQAAAASSSLLSLAVSPGGVAHDGSVSAARTSKWRRSSMDITNEEEGKEKTTWVACCSSMITTRRLAQVSGDCYRS